MTSEETPQEDTNQIDLEAKENADNNESPEDQQNTNESPEDQNNNDNSPEFRPNDDQQTQEPPDPSTSNQETEAIPGLDSKMSRDEFSQLLDERPSTATRKIRKPRFVKGPYRPSYNTDETSNTDIKTITEQAAEGKPCKIEDQVLITRVIHNLRDQRRESISSYEYLKTRKLENSITNLKTISRLKDRETNYAQRIDVLKQKLETAKAQLESVKNDYKNRQVELKNQFKIERDELTQKQKDAEQDLEKQWNDEATFRKFSKRSPLLLYKEHVEKIMVYAGQYEEADTQRKKNLQTEKQEAEQRLLEMKRSYDNAKRNFLVNKNKQSQVLDQTQDYRQNQLNIEEEKAIAVEETRVKALQNELNELQAEPFYHLKFKHPAQQVLPISVVYPGTQDFPPIPKAKPPRAASGKLADSVYGSSPLPLLKNSSKSKSEFGDVSLVTN